jgi:hypothetical protein
MQMKISMEHLAIDRQGKQKCWEKNLSHYNYLTTNLTRPGDRPETNSLAMMIFEDHVKVHFYPNAPRFTKEN